jgi:2-octaprenyl-6-methoxyphenol hydroxylase
MELNADRFDIVIGGGGIAGLALACALADALDDRRIAVVDRAPLSGATIPADIRASALSAGSKHLLDALGVWALVAAEAQPVTAIDITDSSLGDAIRPILLSYDNVLTDREPGTYILENDRLRGALLEAASMRPGIALLGQCSIGEVRFERHGVQIDLGERSLSAALLVGADGRASRLRQQAGIKVVRWSYPQTGIVTTVRHAKPHHGRALQHFLPSGPFAILPLPDRRSCITWTEDEGRAREIMALDEAGFLAELDKRFDYRLGTITQVGARSCWPLDMHLARTLVADRFALIGDAAHAVHPIAGQGLNLGLRDVAALAEVVADSARLGLDIGSASTLERYERWRRLDSALSAAAYDGLNRLFSNDGTLLRTTRDFGLALVHRLPALKQFFVTEAAGLTGDVPKLLRGEPV